MHATGDKAKGGLFPANALMHAREPARSIPPVTSPAQPSPDFP